MKRRFESSRAEETLEFGREIGRELTAPALILLDGDLGAGKTLLVRGIVEGLGISDSSEVRSPTFSLVNRHRTPCGTVYHVDLYRLDTLRQQDSIGLQEILADETAFVLIEWGDQLLLPHEGALRIRIRRDDRRGRRSIRVDGGKV
ncbi:MAG TPA: tRNA (adenosine(37)-N6)-threonylcarbamoyltransferase complex ATPase subunit type 1 TsaE [Acidobacteriota bacterium]|nr:tRNA (adenosine(37)-N6)-threonylcarbamoyltransferase complex ATPase subunit type 1 TsaE [Acidobacteriota bacterium]